MSEPSLLSRPIKPDTSAQVSTARYGAIAMAAIALGGFLVAYATSGNDQQPALTASVSSGSNPERPVFREDKSGIFVSLPPNADPSDAHLSTSQTAGRDRLSIVAQLQPRPRPSAMTTRRLPPGPTQAPPARDATEPKTAATSSFVDERREPITPEPSLIEPTSHQPFTMEPTRDRRTTSAEHLTDENEWEDPGSDHPMWDEDASYEPAWDEDEPSDDDGPMSDEPFESEED